jgi:molecular chaperone IbpA
VLTIKCVKKDKSETEHILHRGISQRYFTKSFTLNDDVEVKGAALEDGLLRLSLKKLVPESKKSRAIEIK